MTTEKQDLRKKIQWYLNLELNAETKKQQIEAGFERRKAEEKLNEMHSPVNKGCYERD